MLMLTLAEGPPVYVDAFSVQAVMPLIAPPPPGIPDAMQIPKTIGTRIFCGSGVSVAVKELPDRVSAIVEKATGRPRLVP